MANGLLKLGGLAAVAASMAAGTAPAQAETIYLGTGASPTIVVSGDSPQAYAYGDPLTVSAALTATDGIPSVETVLASTLAFDKVFGVGRKYYFWASATGVQAGSTPVTFTVGLDDASLFTPGWTLTASAFEDNADTAFGVTNALFSKTFDSSNISAFSEQISQDVSNPYSVTLEYVAPTTTLGAGVLGAHGSIAAPEASTWAMMALGFAALGWSAFRRGAKRVAAA